LIIRGVCALVVWAIIIAVTNCQTEENGLVEPVALSAFVGGLFLTGIRSWALRRARKMRRVLEHEPRVRRRVDHRSRNGGFVILGDSCGPEVVAEVNSTVFRIGHLPRGRNVEVLIAGDPACWAVIAPLSRATLFPPNRPLLKRWARQEAVGRGYQCRSGRGCACKCDSGFPDRRSLRQEPTSNNDVQRSNTD